MRPPRFSLACLALAGQAAAWGAAGHQIVATIAQIHLTPAARARVAHILPIWTKGDLAPVAAWADRVRRVHRRV